MELHGLKKPSAKIPLQTSFGPALAICEGLANFDVSVAHENWVKANAGWNKDN